MFPTNRCSTRAFVSSLLFVVFAFVVSTHALAQARPQVGQRSQQAKPQYGPTQPQVAPLRTQSRQTVPQGRQPVRQANAGQQRQVAPRQATGPPKSFALSAADQAQVDKMLDFWEQKTSGIKTLECEFARWVYDPTFGPKDDAKTFTTGEIRYAAVDRGMIREAVVYDFDTAKKKRQAQLQQAYTAAKTPKEKKALEGQLKEAWPYTARKDAVGEHWVCDGKSVFEFSHKTKELVEIKLPPDMQGNAIAEGPLPFMFGAKADKIKERYWIREIARKQKNDPYQLELVPKRRGEDYSKIRVKLDPQKFLPTQMVLYELNQVGRSAYAFRDMKANGAANNLRNFMGGFVSPKTPRGWTKIVKDVGGPAPKAGQQAGPRQGGQQQLGQGRKPATR